MQEADITIEAPKCEGCGERPEVYGSSWCAHCHDFLPEYIKRRVLDMRNALIMIRFHSEQWSPYEIRDAAKKALKKPLPYRLRSTVTSEP